MRLETLLVCAPRVIVALALLPNLTATAEVQEVLAPSCYGRKCPIFQKIRVDSFQIGEPGEVRRLSNPRSALPIVKDLPQSQTVASYGDPAALSRERPLPLCSV